MSKARRKKSASSISGFFCHAAKDPAGTTMMEKAVKLIYRKANIDLLELRLPQKGRIQPTDTILGDIQSCEVFLADITGLDPNILFLLGYAVGCRKSVFVAIQGYSSSEKYRELKELEILSGFDVSSYQNSDDLSDAVRSHFSERPQPLLDRIAPWSEASPNSKNGLFLKGLHRHEIGLAALNAFSSIFEIVCIDDWNEDGAQPLSWYVRNVMQSRGVVGLLIDPKWDQSRAVNARFAFVCGLAIALKRQVLMVGLPGFEGEFLFREWLRVPNSAEACQHILFEAFQPTDEEYSESQTVETPSSVRDDDEGATSNQDSTPAPSRTAHAEELRQDLILLNINLGEPVAENEEYELTYYFVKTGQYSKVASAKQALVVGAKGTGKTAIFFQLREDYSSDKRNLVCYIKPADYMVSSFLQALRTVSGDKVSHITDSAWKLIVYAQILRVLAEGIRNLPIQVVRTAEQQALVEFVAEYEFLVDAPFEKQLETAASWLEDVAFDGTDFSRAIHERFLSRAKRILAPMLHEHHSTVILVDNLDKAWKVDSDLRLQAQMVFSLLGLPKRIRTDLAQVSREQLDIRGVKRAYG